jgi:hypothetical protein
MLGMAFADMAAIETVSADLGDRAARHAHEVDSAAQQRPGQL